MDFTFNIGWMFGGIIITLIGGLIVVYYRQIADNMEKNGIYAELEASQALS